MRYLRILIVLAWAGSMAALSSPAPVCAQSNPPFQNPSLDSNCYFPQIGDLSEMDTICGSVAGQELGSPVIKNLGTKPGGGYGNMLIGDLVPPLVSEEIYTFSQVQTGPTFNLHKMMQYLQKLNPDNGAGSANPNGLATGFTLGHFHDQAHLNIFEPGRIYWADDNGNYDSTNYTVILANIPSGDFKIDGGIYYNLITPYIAHLTSDTIDDIVTMDFSDYISELDTAYVLLYHGGSNLYGKDTAFEDTSAILYPTHAKDKDFRAGTQADFRGVGRDDLIVSDNIDNLCYYKNDPPFSLSQFAQAIATDTIFAIWQNPQISFNGALSTWFTMRALPKAPGDNSVDFMPMFDTSNAQGNTSNGSIFMFRGGPDFGSHRFTLNSAAFVLHAPATVDDGTPYWGNFADAGDMTGTGNRVLYTCGSNEDGSVEWDNFFVTGKALDNKIDMYNVSNSGAHGDTLTANDDSLEDFLLYRNGANDEGTLWLYYGSKQIPVHLNTQWAEVKTEIEQIPQRDGAGITLSPNPTQLWSVATIVWPQAEEADLNVYDLLGTAVQTEKIRLLGGPEQQRIYFPNLAAGVYVVEIHGASGIARAKLVIVH